MSYRGRTIYKDFMLFSEWLYNMIYTSKAPTRVCLILGNVTQSIDLVYSVIGIYSFSQVQPNLYDCNTFLQCVHRNYVNREPLCFMMHHHLLSSHLFLCKTKKSECIEQVPYGR